MAAHCQKNSSRTEFVFANDDIANSLYHLLTSPYLIQGIPWSCAPRQLLRLKTYFWGTVKAVNVKDFLHAFYSLLLDFVPVLALSRMSAFIFLLVSVRNIIISRITSLQSLFLDNVVLKVSQLNMSLQGFKTDESWVISDGIFFYKWHIKVTFKNRICIQSDLSR